MAFTMQTDTLVLATANPHKAEELRTLLAPLGVTVRDLSEFPGCPDIVEDGDTLEENAFKKALTVHVHTGLPALADDTGLEVYYLLGRPGVYSARYAGEDATYADNVRQLLRELTQVPARKRTARFRAVLAFVDGRRRQTFDGVVEGTITLAPRGGNGFGYDPVFQPAGSVKTFAEMSAEEKHAISHRGRAVAAFLKEFTHQSAQVPQ